MYCTSFSLFIFLNYRMRNKFEAFFEWVFSVQIFSVYEESICRQTYHIAHKMHHRMYFSWIECKLRRNSSKLFHAFLFILQDCSRFLWFSILTKDWMSLLCLLRLKSMVKHNKFQERNEKSYLFDAHKTQYTLETTHVELNQMDVSKIRIYI